MVSIHTNGGKGELVTKTLFHCVRFVDASIAKSGPLCPLTLKLNCPPANEMLLMPGAESGLTITEKVCMALRLGVPLSATFSVKLLVEFAWVTSGRKLNAPLLVFSVALAAPASSAKVNVCGG